MLLYGAAEQAALAQHESAVRIQATARGRAERHALAQHNRRAWRAFRAEAAEVAADPAARAAAEALFRARCGEGGGVKQDAVGAVMAAITEELYEVVLSPATFQLAATVVGRRSARETVRWAEFDALYATVLQSPLIAGAQLAGRTVQPALCHATAWMNQGHGSWLRTPGRDRREGHDNTRHRYTTERKCGAASSGSCCFHAIHLHCSS